MCSRGRVPLPTILVRYSFQASCGFRHTQNIAKKGLTAAIFIANGLRRSGMTIAFCLLYLIVLFYQVEEGRSANFLLRGSGFVCWGWSVCGSRTLLTKISTGRGWGRLLTTVQRAPLSRSWRLSGMFTSASVDRPCALANISSRVFFGWTCLRAGSSLGQADLRA